jgi:transposase-like protein
MGKTELETQVCLNDKCPDYKKKNTGKIIKKGFNEKGYQMYKCKICGVRYPESKGTVFYNRHLTEEQIILIALGSRGRLGYCKILIIPPFSSE